MSRFFDSEIVRKSMIELEELQQKIFSDLFQLPFFDKEQKKEHLDTMREFLEKQRNLVFRISLSDDPEAVEMKEKVINSAILMGLPPGVDMNIIFNNMTKMLEVMKEQIDKTGSDL